MVFKEALNVFSFFVLSFFTIASVCHHRQDLIQHESNKYPADHHALCRPMASVRNAFYCFLTLASISWIAHAQPRPEYHHTPPANFMNDPQRPFYAGGQWHLYYLYNADFEAQGHTGAGGTAWYYATSSDMVVWANVGVAIDKYKPTASGVVLGDVETGSTVIDSANSAGFGQGAIVALLTQMQEGVQQQSLFWSTDNGSAFTGYSGNPVMPNPDPTNKPNFRDPKVMWDEAASRWLVLMAEGDKIGFYSSNNLKSWSYISGFFPQVDLGTLECPDMFQLDVDGDSSKRTWVLAMGANGYRTGRPTGTAYWTGKWDGATFTTDSPTPQWMDDGPDFYATVTWADSRASQAEQHAGRYAIAWLNNWDYAKDLPYYGSWQGQNSLVRYIQLKTVAGVATLTATPLRAYDGIFASPQTVTNKPITTDPVSASLPIMAGGAYMIRMTVEKASGSSANEVRVRIKSNSVHGTTIGYDFVHAQAFIVRDLDGSRARNMPSSAQSSYDAIRTSPLVERPASVTLAIYVDWNSVEVFVNGGAKAMSALIYPDDGAEDIQVTADSGQLVLSSFSYSEVSTRG
jgi:levanase